MSPCQYVFICSAIVLACFKMRQCFFVCVCVWWVHWAEVRKGKTHLIKVCTLTFIFIFTRNSLSMFLKHLFNSWGTQWPVHCWFTCWYNLDFLSKWHDFKWQVQMTGQYRQWTAARNMLHSFVWIHVTQMSLYRPWWKQDLQKKF